MSSLSQHPDASARCWHRGILTATARQARKPEVAPIPPQPGFLWPLRAGDGARARLFVPSALPPGPAPLVVLLHGAGSGPLQILPVLEDEAERDKFLVLVPQSGASTWDVIGDDFGADVAALDHSLGYVFAMHDIVPDRVSIAGFSDGASYALTLGLINGEMFSRFLAFSPDSSFPDDVTEPHPFSFLMAVKMAYCP